jgi:DNA processing protein
MLSETELRYMLALQRVPNLGDATSKRLLHHLGTAEAIFKSSPAQLSKIKGIHKGRIKHLSDKSIWDAVEEELHFIAAQKISYCTYQEPDYPEALKHCLDGPLLFFYKGNMQWKQKRILSIVGTRKATRQGIAFCEQLIEALSPLDPVIVSGFAYGIDITAHKAAIKHRLQTIGCLAHGFHEIYPKSHKRYCEAVEENGGFITEFWSDDAFNRTNFLKRNRIIAGLGQATLVIESAAKGGSLVTADIANSYDREVFAVPGRPTDTQSKGCNDLIKTQRAHLVNSAADILYHLDWDVQPKKSQQTQLFVTLNDVEEKVMSYLQKEETIELDQLAIRSAIPTFQLASILLRLEMKGVVRPLPGKLFQAI